MVIDLIRTLHSHGDAPLEKRKGTIGLSRAHLIRDHLSLHSRAVVEILQPIGRELDPEYVRCGTWNQSGSLLLGSSLLLGPPCPLCCSDFSASCFAHCPLL